MGLRTDFHQRIFGGVFDCEGVGGWGVGGVGDGLGLCDKGIRVFGSAEEVGGAACVG